MLFCSSVRLYGVPINTSLGTAQKLYVQNVLERKRYPSTSKEAWQMRIFFNQCHKHKSICTGSKTSFPCNEN
jgi:hypothetical protein